MTAPDRTPEHGEAMGPGPELDAEIARRVFGRQVLHAGNAKPVILGEKGEPIALPLPPYSTSIEAAWVVLERLREIGLGVMVASEPDGWEVEITTTEALYQQGYRGFVKKAVTAAEAICTAAVRVLEARSGEAEGREP